MKKYRSYCLALLLFVMTFSFGLLAFPNSAKAIETVVYLQCVRLDTLQAGPIEIVYAEEVVASGGASFNISGDSDLQTRWMLATRQWLQVCNGYDSDGSFDIVPRVRFLDE